MRLKVSGVRTQPILQTHTEKYSITISSHGIFIVHFQSYASRSISVAVNAIASTRFDQILSKTTSEHHPSYCGDESRGFDTEFFHHTTKQTIKNDVRWLFYNKLINSRLFRYIDIRQFYNLNGNPWLEFIDEDRQFHANRLFLMEGWLNIFLFAHT